MHAEVRNVDIRRPGNRRLLRARHVNHAGRHRREAVKQRLLLRRQQDRRRIAAVCPCTLQRIVQIGGRKGASGRAVRDRGSRRAGTDRRSRRASACGRQNNVRCAAGRCRRVTDPCLHAGRGACRAGAACGADAVLNDAGFDVALQFAHLDHRAARQFARPAGLAHRFQRVGNDERLGADLEIRTEPARRRQGVKTGVVAFKLRIRSWRGERLAEPLGIGGIGLFLVQIRDGPGVFREQLINHVGQVFTLAAGRAVSGRIRVRGGSKQSHAVLT